MPPMSSRLTWLTFSAPSRFYALAGALLPWLWACAALLALAGLYIGFFIAPTDAQQGESYRIIFIHVPAAWMSMVVYLAMAAWAARSEEHTSELQSPCNLLCRLLLARTKV